MNIAQLRKYDVANGPGIRTTVFVSGCTHNCYNCFNKQYQDFNFGNQFTAETTKQIIECVKETGRLSILGGEPMQQGWEFVEFLQTIKEETNANIWVWSGYTIEQLLNPPDGMSYQLNALQYIDVLVDGKFIEKRKDLTLKFRGSSNQRILDVQKSLNERKAIVLEDI